MASPIQLTAWSVGSAYADGYVSPERRGVRLSGVVKGHPRKRDGKKVITSMVRRVAGRIITTASGSVYELVGEPEPEYLTYLASIGRTYDAENPIKVLRG